MALGNNIKRIRIARRLTQKQLGELCGINEAQIRRYELGGKNSKPKIETLQKIANALNVSLDELDPTIAIGKAVLETPGVLTDIEKILNTLVDASETLLLNKLVTDFDKLNPSGKEEACKRVNELTQISHYTDIK